MYLIILLGQFKALWFSAENGEARRVLHWGAWVGTMRGSSLPDLSHPNRESMPVELVEN